MPALEAAGHPGEIFREEETVARDRPGFNASIIGRSAGDRQLVVWF